MDKEDQLKAYQEMMGEQAARRQLEEHIKQTHCTCGRKRPPHAIGCPRAKR